MSNDEHMNYSQDSEFLWGKVLLEREFAIEDEIEQVTTQLLQVGQLGKRAPLIYGELGSALSLILQMASCQWGCANGNHLVENLYRRLANGVFASLRLARLGFYNEALSMIRSVAEVANLLELFVVRRSTMDEWANLESKERWKKFSPVRVRELIEETGNRPIVDKDNYSALCEIGVHVNPESARISHQADDTLYAGGEFSPQGFLLVCNELAIIISASLKVSSYLAEVPDDKKVILFSAGTTLESYATSWLRTTNYQDRVKMDMVAELAVDDDSSVFIKALYENKATLLAIDLPNTGNTEATEKLNVHLYTHDMNGTVTLPVFSSHEKADDFMNELAQPVKGMLRSLSLPAQYLLEVDVENVAIIFNPNTKYERHISKEDIKILEELCYDNFQASPEANESN